MDREGFSSGQILMDDVFESFRNAVVLAERKQGLTTLLASRILCDAVSIDSGMDPTNAYIVDMSIHRARACLLTCKHFFTSKGYTLLTSKGTSFSVMIPGNGALIVHAKTIRDPLWSYRGGNPGIRVYLDSATWAPDYALRGITEMVLSNANSLFRGVSALANKFFFAPEEGSTPSQRKRHFIHQCALLRPVVGDKIELAFLHEGNLYHAEVKKQFLA